jgi:hypothetical protein
MPFREVEDSGLSLGGARLGGRRMGSPPRCAAERRLFPVSRRSGPGVALVNRSAVVRGKECLQSGPAAAQGDSAPASRGKRCSGSQPGDPDRPGARQPELPVTAAPHYALGRLHVASMTTCCLSWSAAISARCRVTPGGVDGDGWEAGAGPTVRSRQCRGRSALSGRQVRWPAVGSAARPAGRPGRSLAGRDAIADAGVMKAG